MSYLEALRIGPIGIFLRLAVFYKEEEQVKSTEDRDKPSEDIIPGLTDIMETPHTHSKTGEGENKGYDFRQDQVQVEENIDEDKCKGNDTVEEYISPVFTTACTTIKISKLERDTIREVLEETFFLHESFSYLQVDEYDWNVRKGTDIIDRYKGHSREGIMKYRSEAAIIR